MESNVKEARAESLASYYIRRVKTKLASGEYQMEPASCFCGSSDAIPMIERDRYGFDYRMGVCRKCGIMYANPRMTEESYAKFYNEEYRKIYEEDTDETAEDSFQSGLKQGAPLIELLEHFEIRPKIIFEIGCNTGAWLLPFKEKGAEVHGVDFNERRVWLGKSKGLDLSAGGIEELERIGKKADLIILHHVLEHFTDLERSIARIRNLLTPDGALYIGVPGLYAIDKNILFQNAHTFQFTAQTLTYVLECCGFSEVYSDEFITSIWRISDIRRSKDAIPREEIGNIVHFLTNDKIRIPKMRTVNKFPVAERREHIKQALSYGFPDIYTLLDSRKGREAVIIGGGPSVDLEVDKILSLIEDGAVVIAIERMYQWCIDNGIVPDYVVALDASDDVIESFSDLHPGVTHLLAVQCHSAIFDLLKGKNAYIFNTPQQGIDLATFWTENQYDAIGIINAGGSVTICSMSIAMYLGMKSMHIFGFDCHITSGNYAKNITGVGEIKSVFDVEIDGCIFTTTAPYLSFAQQFFELMAVAKAQGMVDRFRIYGDSMASHMTIENIRG